MIQVLRCADKVLHLDRPQVMGIVNITPDSFSDGGRYFDSSRALAHALELVEEGADILDIGGESTRPGAAEVSVQEELDRVIPIIEALAAEVPVPISIDTSKPEVMYEALRSGAGFLNDVRALQEPGALETAAKSDVPVCLMHMQGAPRTMQDDPHYDDVVVDVEKFFRQRITACEQAGIKRERILLDPGFGFGKSLEHNISLLSELERFQSLDCPLLVGMSRKRMIGTLLGDVPPDKRLYGSVSAAVVAAMKGAAIIRVHDVRPTVEALKVVTAIQR
jgi:dihydropteroate synthase